MLKKLPVLGIVMLAMVACTPEREELVDTSATTVIEPADTAVTATTVATTDTNAWGDYTTWNTIASDPITQEEFNTGFATVYPVWDADRNQTVSRDEMADTWHDWFDGNNDDIIDGEEWNAGIINFNMTGVNWGDYGAWDADTDNRLTADEWRTGFSNIYANNELVRDEVDDQWWDWFDNNNDNLIDENEWRERTRVWDPGV